MDKADLTKIFNRGFRRGANARASQGLPWSKTTPTPEEIPDPPAGTGDISRQIAWTMGYATGYQIGASDIDLASVDVPVTHGMLCEMSQETLEMVGAFEKMSDR